MTSSPSTLSQDTLLITVGSTLFPALTDLALSPEFLSWLIHRGVQNLVVQYGRADLTFPPGTGSPPLNYPVDRRRDGSANFLWMTEGVDDYGLRIRVLRYTDDFEGLVRSAQWVISHAGSGSILTVLRTPRPLLVVPNTDLMDNHQAQLADALGTSGGRQGYLLVSTVENLLYTLPRLLDGSHTPRAFPPVNHETFRNIMDETAGFAP